ncbi:hypothetical protein QTG56_23205 (plasmid) [Rossellomorea sp. AcN35-11]|nr:hypothetical protein [Rossellomorea aquimaris]WJV32275.1 hypothetical protein QTG56_23205 [Rossellomorea sp. AcN35-11]
MSFSIHTAKLDRTLLRDFPMKQLNISQTALNLIFHLTPLVDRDGRIHLDKEVVRKKMYCDRREFLKALNELRETTYKGKKLLTYENGYYVSHFHLPTKGEDSYLKHIPFYNSADFQNLSKNQTRLFLYIATNNVMNQFTRVAVENLYKNTLHDQEYGLNIYDSYKDMAEDLFFLIDKGYISVRFEGQKEVINNNSLNYKSVFHRTFGFKNNKKARTSKYFKQKHKLDLKVNPSLFNKEAIKNEAGKAELRLLADRYHMCHEDIKGETFNFIIGRKKSLMEQFGIAGLEMYRTSLQKYFKEKNENIIYYDLVGKAENTFTDFYLLEEIKKVILSALENAAGDGLTNNTLAYSFKENHIASLIKYWISNTADEHKILIDQDIQQIEDAHELLSGLAAEEPWTGLSKSIQATYAVHESKLQEIFRIECIKAGIHQPHELLAEIDSKELIVSLASKSLLSRHKYLEEEANELKQIVRFFRKKHIPLSKRLEERQDEEQKPAVKRIDPRTWLY